jgi:nucleoside 2-deoxyribosyltransferase
MPLKVYLAGPEVFMPDARAILDLKAERARAAGFEPLSPGDLVIPPSETKAGMGLAISQVNEGMMRAADAVIANLTPFRGIAADVGTAFEVGFMCAQGKLVYAYTNVAEPHYARCSAYYGGRIHQTPDGRHRGPDGISIEDFDMADNLMLDGGIAARGGALVIGNAHPDRLYTDLAAFEECLRLLAEQQGTVA